MLFILNLLSNTMFWSSLAEMTFRISTLRTIKAKATMTQEGKFSFADFLSCKNSRQHKIQDCNLMVEAAGGYTEKWHLIQVSYKEHGTRKYGSTVVDFSRSRQPNTMAGYIVRIHTHPTAQQKQIASPVKLSPDNPVDHLSVIRSKVKGRNL